MAIVGIGIDIVEVARVEQIIVRSGSRLAKRILAESEWEEYLQLSKNSERFLAKRFAAKEAAAKALGTGIRQGVAFNQLVVTHDHLGKPHLCLSGKAAELAHFLQIQHIHISLADEQCYVCATVIMET